MKHTIKFKNLSLNILFFNPKEPKIKISVIRPGSEKKIIVLASEVEQKIKHIRTALDIEQGSVEDKALIGIIYASYASDECLKINSIIDYAKTKQHTAEIEKHLFSCPGCKSIYLAVLKIENKKR